MSDEKKVKIVNGEGQETFVPESIASDDTTLKRLLASFYGTDNFRLDRKQENGETVVQVVKMAGAKGYATSSMILLKNCPGRENPVVMLYRELAGVDISCLTPEELCHMQKQVEATLETGQELYNRMQACRARLIRSSSFPAPILIPGF